jgi:hypothetical protein
MIAGLLLAVGCAIGGSVAMLLKQRGAVAAPTVLARHTPTDSPSRIPDPAIASPQRAAT